MMRSVSVQRHPIAPVFDGGSRILILGSFPSVKSREAGFFYAHPQNRFWRVLACAAREAVPCTVDEKKRFLLSHGIALWDVIASCNICGSSDSSVTDVTPNDLSPLFAASPRLCVAVNGKTAERFYRRFDLPQGYPEPILLPSTSPANAAWSLDRLVDAWKRALQPFLIAGDFGEALWK